MLPKFTCGLGWQKPSFYKHHSHFLKRIRSGWLGRNVQLVTAGVQFFRRALWWIHRSVWISSGLRSPLRPPSCSLTAACTFLVCAVTELILMLVLPSPLQQRLPAPSPISNLKPGVSQRRGVYFTRWEPAHKAGLSAARKEAVSALALDCSQWPYT